MTQSSEVGANIQRVIQLATKHRLPAIYAIPEYAEAGGLMAYGGSRSDLARRAATYVDKILKGATSRRTSGGAADEVRVRDQSENSEADRPDDSAECAGAGGSR